jgi:signal transduction histidine kinase
LVLRQRRLDALQKLNAGLEARVAERTHSLTLANQELDAFAYTISHDLRAPLRAIHGYSDVINEEAGPSLTEELRGYLGRIGLAADAMNRLIEDILAYAKLSKEALAVRPVSLEAAVARAQAQLHPDCAEAEVRVIAPLGEVMAHPAALEQSLENLLSNACKYVSPGQRASITIRAETRNGCRRLWVEDNGIGIAPEHHERIFKPFERLHGVEAYPGTGIGLAIVQRSIERMGGSSGVEPIASGGSAFWIQLPMVESE